MFLFGELDECATMLDSQCSAQAFASEATEAREREKRNKLQGKRLMREMMLPRRRRCARPWAREIEVGPRVPGILAKDN